ncbi:esterase/lipase family protein [Corynebacterium terpenotabidum]|uniref:Triacylglycerol lipase n=1 Tax=Corynebacterium terpenotabidum Y-11 TaxID=1200352 RepID=S4XAG7_9CORY|nr:alpha/beta fold hydrolase [Corynebacterium terpenotabidum]AGP30137.1 triacylglycerol lipase [Corynebacterium terpenotabidum Y-11]
MKDEDLAGYIDALTAAAAADNADPDQRSWTEQLASFSDGLRNAFGMGSRLVKLAPKGSDAEPVGARQSFAGYVDDHWSARPEAYRPYPVVLIHGTISAKAIWQNLVNLLRDDGFVVFAPDYGHHGTGELRRSARDLAAYIDQVLAATGAEKVDLVGHSQGGLLARHLINEMDFDDKVHHLVTLSAPHHGTSLNAQLASLISTNDLAAKVAEATVTRFMGVAGMQQVIGSPFLTDLSYSPETRPGVRYTCLATKVDTTVVPPESGFLEPDTENADGTQVRVINEFVQERGAGRVLHNEMPTDPDVQRIVHEVLVAGLE